MFGRLAFAVLLGLLIVASLRTEPLKVSQAQVVTSTPTRAATSTGTSTATLTNTPTPAPATSTPTATSPAPTRTVTVPTDSTTPTPTGTAGPTRTAAPTSSPTATRTATRTAIPSISATPTSSRVPTSTSTLSPTSTTTPTVTPTSPPPVIQGITASSITRSGATITWTTTLPATSQVEYGTGTGAESSRSTIDASLVTGHRQVLTGLTPGVTYHYRVRSVNAGGVLTISMESIFVTSPEGTGPDVVGVSARRLTATTASIAWNTDTGTVAQVEYGTTANYGAFTLLKLFSVPGQEILLTGLRPATDYHFRINAWDGIGSLGASGDFMFRTAIAGPATLMGDPTIQTERVSLPAGRAASYQYVAEQSGQVSVVSLYVDAGSSATVVRVALYSDQAGTPGTILTQGSAPGLTPGWVTVNLPPVSLVQGARYWVAVLAPIGSGGLSIRDAGRGGSSLLSRQEALAAFPQTWSSGVAAARSPMSVQVLQVPPAVTLTGPVDGAIVTSNVTLSAVVDDDVPIARVQFYVDGIPVGPALTTAPYAVTWDSSSSNAALPHNITARANDFLGRSAVSGMLSVQVDNGPVISGVTLSSGLTTSSARINWTTDVLSDAQVEFGPTLGYGSSTPVDLRAGWSHEAQLTGLAPGTTYHYRVRSRDAYGALAVSQDSTFFTPEP